MNKKTILSFIIFTLQFLTYSYSIFGQSFNQEECTIGVAIGWATDDGRPLLWKTRDEIELNNEVKYNTSFKYKFISVSNAGSSTLSWMGVNEHGFAILNSSTADLVTNTFGPGNGTLMRDVLGNCKTVVEFQNYLDSTNITGRSTRANFGVIDSTGAAAIFETGGNRYTKFDADSATNGYIVRTNFSITGGGSTGMARYNRSNTLINNFYTGDSLNYKSIIRYQMRDFSDDNSIPVSIPYANVWESGIPYGYINCQKSICHSNSVSTAVIHGVLPMELPGLTTMWVILGHPASSIALPYWPVGNTPIEADGISTAELCDKAKEIKKLLFDYTADNNYIDSYKLYNANGEGLWSCLLPIEDYFFSETEHYLDSLHLLATLPINSLINKEANNAIYALSELENCKNSLIMLESFGLFNIYPNPFVDIINIYYAEKRNFKIQIFNTIGECVLQKEFSSRTNEIDVSSLARGVYIIRLIAAKRTYQQKLIKI